MNQTNASPRGFTLIELLIVIAIIGILSATVLVSLGTARSKGNDASTRRSFTEARTQAELFYQANGNKYYTDATTQLCGSVTVNGVQALNTQLLAIQKTSGATSLAVVPSAAGLNNRVTCHATSDAWAIEAPLRSASVANPMYCTDSTGKTMITSGTSLAVNDVTCGP